MNKTVCKGRQGKKKLFKLIEKERNCSLQTGFLAMEASMVDAEYMKEIERSRRDLRAIIYSRNAAPHMLRLAWTDAGTYDPKTKTGGPNGSIRNLKAEMDNENTLKIAADFCEEVKAKHPKITYADLYQLAGIVAVEVTGGPTIDFVPGRKDSLKSPEQSRLRIIGEGAESLKEVFSPTGLSNKDIVALFGGQMLIFVHALGRNLSENIPGFECPWTRKPLQFDNHIFKELLLEKGSEEVLKVPGDEKYLVEDPEFRQYMELYAQDEEAFRVDYAASHKKLSELGFTPPKHSEQGSTPPKLSELESTLSEPGSSPPQLSEELGSTSPSFSFKLAVQNNRVLAQVDVAVGLLLGFGVAIAAMWIFGYFCGINRRVM